MTHTHSRRPGPRARTAPETPRTPCIPRPLPRGRPCSPPAFSWTEQQKTELRDTRVTHSTPRPGRSAAAHAGAGGPGGGSRSAPSPAGRTATARPPGGTSPTPNGTRRQAGPLRLGHAYWPGATSTRARVVEAAREGRAKELLVLQQGGREQHQRDQTSPRLPPSPTSRSSSTPGCPLPGRAAPPRPRGGEAGAAAYNGERAGAEPGGGGGGAGRQPGGGGGAGLGGAGRGGAAGAVRRGRREGHPHRRAN